MQDYETYLDLSELELKNNDDFKKIKKSLPYIKKITINNSTVIKFFGILDGVFITQALQIKNLKKTLNYVSRDEENKILDDIEKILKKKIPDFFEFYIRKNFYEKKFNNEYWNVENDKYYLKDFEGFNETMGLYTEIYDCISAAVSENLDIYKQKKIRILDIGAGSGRYVCHLVHKLISLKINARYTMIEPNRSALNYAKNLIAGLPSTGIKIYIKNMTFEDFYKKNKTSKRKFDFIISSGCIFNVSVVNREEALDNTRFLKKFLKREGGIAIISGLSALFFNKEDLKKLGLNVVKTSTETMSNYIINMFIISRKMDLSYESYLEEINGNKKKQELLSLEKEKLQEKNAEKCYSLTNSSDYSYSDEIENNENFIFGTDDEYSSDEYDESANEINTGIASNKNYDNEDEKSNSYTNSQDITNTLFFKRFRDLVPNFLNPKPKNQFIKPHFDI